MSLVFLFIKIFPVFGLALTIVCIDLARNFKRKGNRAWIGMILLGVCFTAGSIAWLIFRGDKNADIWFQNVTDWIQHGF